MKTIRQIAKENNVELKGRLRRSKDENGCTTYSFDNGVVWCKNGWITFMWDDTATDAVCEFTTRRD